MSNAAPTLSLTFDDGPDPSWTPRVLQQLDALDVVATFFVLGTQVRSSPGLIQEIAAAGHRIELHGDRHLDHRSASHHELASDTSAALRTLRNAGVVPTRWRLPWGRPGPATAAVAREHALDIVHWDIDPHDWRGDGWADQPAERRAGIRRGGVFLLHDAIGPGAPRTDAENTIDLIGSIVEEARAAGVEVGDLPDRSASHV